MVTGAKRTVSVRLAVIRIAPFSQWAATPWGASEATTSSPEPARSAITTRWSGTRSARSFTSVSPLTGRSASRCTSIHADPSGPLTLDQPVSSFASTTLAASPRPALVRTVKAERARGRTSGGGVKS